jgi:hypothetical protein
MQLVEAAETVEPDWQDAVRRAGRLGRHRSYTLGKLGPRRALVLVAAVLVGIYAVTAVAADRRPRVVYWLFDRSSETYPLTQVPTVGKWTPTKRAGLDFVRTDKGYVPKGSIVPVLHGTVAGQRFEMQVFMRKEGSRKLLNVGFHPGETPPPYHGTNIPAFSFVTGGAPVHGLSDADEEQLHWVSSGLSIPGPIESSGGGTGPKYHWGLAAANVRQVDLENDDGRVVRVPTFPGPRDLEVRVRVWIAVLRLDHLVHTIVPRDEEGKALEHWQLPIAQ